MVCIVRLLKRRNIDMALSYLLSTILIDNQLSVILNKSHDFEQFSNYVIELGLISRKLNSFAPYFINSIVILKQSNVINISEGFLQLNDQSFPDGDLGSIRLRKISNNIDFLLDICKNLSSKEMYNKLIEVSKYFHTFAY